MALGALVQSVLAVFAAPAPPPDPVELLAPRQKAALVVVSGLPAPKGVAGVIVRRWDREEPRPPGALVFVDQEGGEVRAFPGLPPALPASAYARRAEAFAAGRATGRALRREGVHADLAPVLDLASGPLGSRHFRDPRFGIAFARGLRAGGAVACVKHFPGLGAAPVSTDDARRVRARLVRRELAAFRAAVRARVACVMTSHAFYGRRGRSRASLAPWAYRLLRRAGFRGVAITDSLGVLGSSEATRAARLAVRAGADLVLFTSAEDARAAIRALLPLARTGLLDAHVRRVLRLRESAGLARGGGW